jgi:hypothetical protein
LMVKSRLIQAVVPLWWWSVCTLQIYLYFPPFPLIIWLCFAFFHDCSNKQAGIQCFCRCYQYSSWSFCQWWAVFSYRTQSTVSIQARKW